MVKAARRHNRVVQVGIQRRSSAVRARRRPSWCATGAIGKVTGRALVPRPERVAEGHRHAAGRRAAGGLRLGRVARPGAEADVQQEPHVLPLPLVLRLLRRAAHQLRRPLPRRDPLGARPRRAAGGHRDGRQVRDYDNREVPDTLEVLWHVSRRHARDVLAVQRHGGAAGAGQPRARSSSAARRARCISVQRRLRDRAGDDHAQRVPRAHAAGPAVRAGLPHRREAADRATKVTGGAPTRRPRAQLPRLREEPGRLRVRHRVRPPRARRPR